MFSRFVSVGRENHDPSPPNKVHHSSFLGSLPANALSSFQRSSVHALRIVDTLKPKIDTTFKALNSQVKTTSDRRPLFDISRAR
ncbi:unnamed protein product [Sphenostylis stenocarpa]|uniref:Uncharacterized protein n=1 Tax=Sphenostylis stenocarpa TaxID=92480 RepID=A0AA86RRT1_9FABA|nr:unnamed protein product [Sphenostylis stenocarpa]